MSNPPYDAVILAGGRSRRMGVDKTKLVVGTMTMLDHAIAAVCGSQRTVVVGPARPTLRPVEWTREFPPGGGPAAALAAGLDLVTAEVVFVLAADMPFVTGEIVTRLVMSTGPGGAYLVDDTGRQQWLCSSWPVATLRSLPLRRNEPLHGHLSVLPAVAVRLETSDTPAWLDCDSIADLRRARERV